MTTAMIVVAINTPAIKNNIVKSLLEKEYLQDLFMSLSYHEMLKVSR